MQTLKSLVNEMVNHALQKGLDSVLEIQDLLKNYNGIDWKSLVEFSDETYARVVLHRCELLQVVLIGWQPNQTTSFHAHPSGGCLMKFLSGCMEEIRYSPNEMQREIGRCCYASGDMAYVHDDFAYHVVRNPTVSQKAVSLHVYSPGIYASCKISDRAPTPRAFLQPV